MTRANVTRWLRRRSQEDRILDAVQRKVDEAYRAGYRDGAANGRWDPATAEYAAKIQCAFPPPNTLPPLTDRQVEVLILAAEGLTNQAIADQLGVKRETVKFHLSGVYATLGVRNRTGAVHRARELGVLT